MSLFVKEDYEAPTISGYFAADEIYVDDLRADNDPSLELVKRINTFDELKSWFKLDVLTTQGGDLAQPGESYFRVVGFYLRTGIAAFIPIVLNEFGDPLPDIFIWASWPSAPAFPQGARVVPDYSENGGGVGGFTKANGDIGFGYSGGAVVGGDGGVYRIWASADPPGQPRQRADCGIKLGWFGGTDHLTANPIIQVTKKVGEDPPPPPTTGNSYVSVVINGIEQAHIGLTAKATIEVA